MPNVHDVATDDNFIFWLTSQNPDTKFDFGEPDDCVFARFLKSKGFIFAEVVTSDFYPNGCNGLRHSLPPRFRMVSEGLSERYAHLSQIPLSYGQVLALIAQNA